MHQVRDLNRVHLTCNEYSVCTFFKFDTEEEAVTVANDTSMGLASYCFTKNVDRLWRLFENLEAGMIGLNTGKPPNSCETWGYATHFT